MLNFRYDGENSRQERRKAYETEKKSQPEALGSRDLVKKAMVSISLGVFFFIFVYVTQGEITVKQPSLFQSNVYVNAGYIGVIIGFICLVLAAAYQSMG